MKVVAVGPELNLEVREVPVPEPGEGEVRVLVRACGICGSDLHMLPSGALPEGAVMGHEIAGTVDAVGDGVDGWSEGDPVCVYPFAPLDHLDIAAAMGSGIGLGMNDGGYAEALTVPAEMLWRLPEGVDLADGALVEPLAVALHGIDVSGAEPGQPVCVLGCGPIGAMVIVALRGRGYERVVAVEPNPERRALAERLGASAAFGLEGVHEAVVAELGAAPEVVLEAAGPYLGARPGDRARRSRGLHRAARHARRAGADLPAQRDAQGGPVEGLLRLSPEGLRRGDRDAGGRPRADRRPRQLEEAPRGGGRELRRTARAGHGRAEDPAGARS